MLVCFALMLSLSPMAAVAFLTDARSRGWCSPPDPGPLGGKPGSQHRRAPNPGWRWPRRREEGP